MIKKKHPGGGHRGFGPAIFPARDLKNYQSNAGRRGKEKHMQDTPSVLNYKSF
jgi:hypothetical protein